MIVYLIKRLLFAVITLLAILALSYLLLRLAPGDPTRSSLLSSDSSAGTSDAAKGLNRANTALRKKLRLDEPILTGFAYWLRDVASRGDFGDSAAVDPGRPVTAIIMERLPVTLRLNLCAILITYLGAVWLGVYSALYAQSWRDHAITFALFLLSSLPAIWVGLLLQSLFCVGGRWPVFPLKGLAIGNTDGLSSFVIAGRTLMHYVLPVFCLAYAGFAGLSRYARAGMIEVLKQDYVRTARAKGLPEYDVVMHHAFRNALITLITLFSGLLPGLVAGSVIVEYIFNIPGMGLLSLAALSSRDYPLQMALFFFAGVLTLGGILISDLLYMAADPRITLTGRSRTGK